MKKSEIAIRPGQIWRDRDKRALSGNRHIRIYQVGHTKRQRGPNATDVDAAMCESVFRPSSNLAWRAHNINRTLISYKNLRGKFELVEDVDTDSSESADSEGGLGYMQGRGAS